MHLELKILHLTKKSCTLKKMAYLKSESSDDDEPYSKMGLLFGLEMRGTSMSAFNTLRCCYCLREARRKILHLKGKILALGS